MINRKCTISEYYRGLETQGCPDFRFFLLRSVEGRQRGNTYVNQKDRRKSRSIYINRITYPEPAELQMFSAWPQRKSLVNCHGNELCSKWRAARNLKKGTQAKESKIWYINVLMTRTDESRTDPFLQNCSGLWKWSPEHNCIYQKSGICRFFLMIENTKKILARSFSECMLRQEENKDGLIIIGRCNPLALKKLNQKYRSVVSVNRNSTNYEVDEVLCDGKKLHRWQLNIWSRLVIETSDM